MIKKKIALGLSGGVDSAVSAYLLKKQGYDVYCIYLNCYDYDDPTCRAKQDRADALKIALHLNLPFQVLDFKKEYQAAVIGYFKKEYLAGRTPNPDVVCNRDIKFGLFLDWVIKNGFDYVATGHYAEILCHPERRAMPAGRQVSEESKDLAAGDTNIFIGRGGLDSSIRRFTQNDADTQKSTSVLRIPRDLRKDQTYFLWQVPREKFQHVLFPLADYLKSEVRQIAREIKLPVADKKDSTGICFVGEISVEEFLKRLGVKEKRGEVVIKTALKITNYKHQITNKSQITSTKSETKKNLSLEFENCNLFGTGNLELGASANYKVIGTHKGVWFYTIGQRHGWQITNSKLQITNGQTDRPPLYVIEKDVKNNRLIVGFGAETYRDSFEVGGCNWLKKVRPLNLPGTFGGSDLKKLAVADCLVRLRHCGDLIECKLSVNRYPLIVKNAKRITNNYLRFTVRLKEPQRGIAPGQSAVFYDKTGIVLGGGVIQ